MSTYTCGPWHEKGDDGMSIVSSNGRFVAGCQNVFADPQENADNARLIAAAPELLEALRYAEAFIAIAVPSTARDREEAINEVLPAIRAAIAKATGNG